MIKVRVVSVSVSFSKKKIALPHVSPCGDAKFQELQLLQKEFFMFVIAKLRNIEFSVG